MQTTNQEKHDGRRILRPSIIAGALTTIIILAVVSLAPFHVLQITVPRKDTIVLYKFISPSDTLALGYNHSVELSMVWDFFLINDKYRIVLYETHFHSSNAGLPATVDEGEKIHLEGEVMRISNRRREIPSLSLWVDEKSANTLHINQKETLFLPKLAGDTLLDLSIKKTTLFRYAVNNFKILLH